VRDTKSEGTRSVGCPRFFGLAEWERGGVWRLAIVASGGGEKSGDEREEAACVLARVI
jgi:hypothetical protein